MNILGIIASSQVTAAGDFESIATVTVGSGGSSTVTFSSIPATYTHLQVRAICQTTTSGGPNNIRVGFNSDTGNNYALHRLIGDGSAASAASVSSTGFGRVGVTTSTDYTSMFAANVIDILDYANTNKYKTTRSLGGSDTNSSNGFLMFHSSLWQNTAAISTITLDTDGTAFAQYSHFALYGIKGA